MGENHKNSQKKGSFLNTVREVDAAGKKAALEQEARIAEAAALKEEKQRKAYEEKLRQERLELMKLKQGLISDADIDAAPVVKKEYTLREKISNFFYHEKWYLLAGAAALFLIVFLAVDYMGRERPDVQAAYIAPDYDMSYYSSELTALWSGYCEDVNGNGEKLARLYYIPTGYADDSMASLATAQSDRTKLIGEFQSGNTVMIIGNKKAYQSIGVLEDVFADARELFPGDPYAEEIGYRLAGTDFMKILGCDTVDDTELYVSFRLPRDTMGMKADKMQVNFDNAVKLWKNFLAEHRVDGLELPPTEDYEPLPDLYEQTEEETSVS